MPARLSPVRLALSLAALAALAGLTWWCVRLALADRLYHRDRAGDLKAARALAPGNARYWSRSLTPGEPSEIGDLRRALSLNPADSSSWMELGLLHEVDGDYSAAERCLLEATRVDKTFDPAWTMANFYFRRGNAERFWPWARRAAYMAYQDRTPLFRLCWRLTQDSGVILSRGIPDDRRVLGNYLAFLLAEDHRDAVEPAAARLAAFCSGEDLTVLLAAVDDLIEGGRHDGALRLWNALAGRRLISAAPLDPSRGRFLTNGDFSSPPLLRGFDWRVVPHEGVSVARDVSPPALKLTFSGKQPEQCEVLRQAVPLAGGKRYTLRFGFRSEGIPAESGPRWVVYDAVSGRPLSGDSPSLSGPDWTTQALEFTAPPEISLARLAVAYRRAPGTTRIEGSVWIREVTLLAAPESPDQGRSTSGARR